MKRRRIQAAPREKGGIMYKIMAIVAAFALVGAGAIVSLGWTEPVQAHTVASGKGDRLDAKPFGAACSQTSWPYYETSCLRSTVTPTRDARPVRLVTTDRLPQ